MATLVGLLGRPTIHHGGARLEPPRGKTAALLFYLAYRADWSGRDELLDLFWPDTLEHRARGNLRSLLSRSLRQLAYAGDLEVESARLRWCVPTDVREFHKALGERRWDVAMRLYAGELLQGFWLDGAPAFEGWLEAERRGLHASWREAGLRLAGALEAAGLWAQAAEALGRLCAADPWDEESLRRYARDLHADGRRERALEVLETFWQGLERELGAAPEPATRQLAEDIRRAAGRPWPVEGPAAVRDATGAASGRSAPKPGYKLPGQATPFVGRERERASVAALLGEPDCRLVTLVGPGGVGKTRLALAVARQNPGAPEDGVCFVPCASARDPAQLVYAVADALSLPLFGPAAPERQLLEFLRHKEMLLVLDNLEHLLPDVELVRDLLEDAPGVRMLATSRQRLSLQREQVFDVPGLPVPEEDALDAEACDAVRLFAQCARRSRNDFALGPENAEPVMRICRLVDGLPLAIELAASWLRVVSAADVAAEIERGIDILRAPLQDVPERHRSVRAVFDYSWRVLTADEQRVLRALSVFRGGFARAAAERVAGANLGILAGLVNKSFLNAAPSGRYHMHPLVQQYLQEKLADTPDQARSAQSAHGGYYTEYLHERRSDLMGGRQLEAVREIATELDNIRTAWRWALERERPDCISRQALALANFYMYRSRYQEWLAVFGEAVERLLAWDRSEQGDEQRDLALVMLLTHLGWCHHRLGRFGDAARAARRCLAVYRRLGIPPVPGPATDPVLVLGLLACVRGDFSAAARYGARALATAEAHGHLHNQSVAQHVLARAALGQDQFAAGERHAQAAYHLAQRNGDRWHLANCHIELGHAACALGNGAAARQHFRSSYLICEEFDDKGGMAKALNELGELALRRRALGEARDAFRQSLALTNAVREGKGLAKALCGLGDAMLALGELGAAREYYRQALEMAAEMGSLPLMLPVGQGVCRLLASSGQEERAERLAAELGPRPADPGGLAAAVAEGLSALVREEPEGGDR